MRDTSETNFRRRPAAWPRRAPSSRRLASGFTLLELLVALTMAVILAGSLYTTLRIGFRARTQAESAVEPIRTAELATGLLRADFESALPAKGTLAGAFVGVDNTGDGGLPADTVEFFTVGNPNDELGLSAQGANQPGIMPGSARPGMNNAAPVTALPAEARKVQIGLVSYPAAAGGSEQVLVRRVTTNLLSQVEVEPDEEVLCRGVRSLNLRYYDGLTWQDSWDSTQIDNNIPAAVELVIELDRSDEYGLRIIRFPRVFLLSCSTVATASTTGTGQTGTSSGAGGGTP